MFQRFQESAYKPLTGNFSFQEETPNIHALIRKGGIPISHKQLASNYMVVKKIFGFSAVHAKITNSELSLLNFYNFKPLQETTAASMIRELETLGEWAREGDEIKQKQSNNIFEIRIKELKFLRSSNSTMALNEMYDGYSILEKYIELIGG